jgi:hypothetical protein
MPLQPNGAGLTEGAVAYLNAPTSQRIQHIEGFGVAGLATGPTFDVPPKQAVRSRVRRKIDNFI